MIKNRFASEKDIKTDLVDILQTLILAKKCQGIRKKGKKRMKSSKISREAEGNFFYCSLNSTPHIILFKYC